jgi:hypothetical protein
MIDDLGRTPAAACSYQRLSAFICGCRNEPNLVGTNVRNEPNLARPHRRWVPWGPRMQNEPNLPTRTTKRAKRTQFPAVDTPQYSNFPLFQHFNPTPIVQNEPNSGPGRAGHRAIVRNEAKLGRTGACGQKGHRKWSGFAGRWNVRNEPNSRLGRVGRGSKGGGRGAIVRNEANLHRKRKVPSLKRGPGAGYAENGCIPADPRYHFGQ